MLCLSRHPGEQIVIAGNIRITVVEIIGNRVKLGIEAPKSVRVDRQEVHEQRQYTRVPSPGRDCATVDGESLFILSQ